MSVGVELEFRVVRDEEAALPRLLRAADRRRARPVGAFVLLHYRIRNSGALDVSAEKLGYAGVGSVASVTMYPGSEVCGR